MNVRQQKFCDYYLQSCNATDAAKKAGYSERTAYSIGEENLKKPEIKKYLAEHGKKAHKERIATAEEVLAFWSEVLRDRKEKTQDRLRASENLGKRYALFTDNVSMANEGVTVYVNLTDYGEKSDADT